MEYKIENTTHLHWENDHALRLRFAGICHTILYSEDKLEVKKAYDQLFTMYKSGIISGAKHVQQSCFEEVIYKILNEEINQKEDEYYHGEKYPAFVKLLALVKVQTENRKTFDRLRVNQFLVGEGVDNFPLMNIDRMIMNFVYNQSSKDEKNEALKFFLNKYISILTIKK